MRQRSSLILVLVVALTLSVSMVHAQGGKVIKIASQSPLSGGQSPTGTGIRNAVELAIAQLSGPLKELGYDVQFVPFDDQATPDVGVSNAQQIVADAAILGVVGHYNSGVAIPSSEVYNANNLVMVSPANTGAAVTDRGLPTVNRVCSRDDAQGPAGAKYAASLGTVKTVYVLNDTTTYGQGVAQFFSDAATADGLTVLGFEGTAEKANFDSVIQPILAQTPDLVYFGGIYDQIGIFVSQLRSAGYTGLIMGADGLDDSHFATLAGDGGVGTYFTTTAGPASAFPNAKQFFTDYSAKYGTPSPYTAQSYDATAIILKAIETVAKTSNGEIPAREAVAAAVRATKDFQGLTGTITFDANGDPQEANIYVLKVGSSDPAKWPDNPVISTVKYPSPLYAKEMTAAMTPEASATAEATP